MTSKYQGKYRIESARLAKWDYGWNGYYYITINTQNRQQHFGRIENGRMVLSEIGEIAKEELLKTPEIRLNMNITIDEYVIMPDHLHAIIHIGPNPYNRWPDPAADDHKEDIGGKLSKDARHDVSKDRQGFSKDRQGFSKDGQNLSSIKPGISSTPADVSRSKQGPQSNNLSSILRGFKSAVAIRARQINPTFAWQERFHDSIIRDKRSLNNVRRYIRNNPQNWKK